MTGKCCLEVPQLTTYIYSDVKNPSSVASKLSDNRTYEVTPMGGWYEILDFGFWILDLKWITQRLPITFELLKS
jgi:hypothetical protein